MGPIDEDNDPIRIVGNGSGCGGVVVTSQQSLGAKLGPGMPSIPSNPQYENRPAFLTGMSAGLAPEPERDPRDCTPPMRAQWGPQGIEFARFHLAGDLDVRVLHPPAGLKNVQVEILTGAYWGDGQDTRKSTVLHLSKSRARALASAIMGAAAEL
jgi:hypothetical protein